MAFFVLKFYLLIIFLMLFLTLLSLSLYDSAITSNDPFSSFEDLKNKRQRLYLNL